MLQDVKKALRRHADPKKAVLSQRYFKSGPGEYAEGDMFLGVTLPFQHAVAKEFYQKLTLEETTKLLHEPWHEERLTALFILVLKYQKGDATKKQQVVDVYLTNTRYVNNWDLVDSSASYILGNWLLDKKDHTILYDFAKSKLLWERRISIISTLGFIRNNQFDDTLKLAEKLLGDSHDLIHKAVGWSLREVGKKSPELLTTFLDKHGAIMPRTALRYSIEKFDTPIRLHYMGLKNK